MKNDSEIQDMLRDIEVRRQALTEALLTEEGQMPNTDHEWQLQRRRFRQIDGRRHYLRGVLTGLAAAVLLCLVAVGLFWHHLWTAEPVLVYAAQSGVEDITLQTGTSLPIGLSQLDDTRLTQVGDSILFDFTSTSAVASAAVTTSGEVPLLETLQVPMGRELQVTLPDSKRVWLNGGSRLTFPAEFATDYRLVKFEGEAYFEVAHDVRRPFMVQTSRLQTCVLGTQFFLDCREGQEASHSVTLVEGSVSVCGVDAAGATTSQSVVLSPGQCFSLMPNGEQAVTDVETDSYVAWRDGYFYFDDEPLIDVMQALGCHYNLNVIFEDPSLLQLHMRFICQRHTSIDEAINLLNHFRRIHAKVVDDTIYIK